MEDTTNTLQPNEEVKSEQPEESLEELSQKRDFQIKQKKIFYNKIKAVVIILFITLTGLFISYVMYERQRTTAPVKPVVVNDDTNEQPAQPEDTWELHRDDNLKVFVKVPPEAKVVTSTNPNKLEVIYSRTEQDFNKVNVDNLTDGYIFRITPLSLGTRDLAKIAEIKRDSFDVVCPDTASISIAQDSMVDSISSKFFEVSNCNVEYIVSYVPRFGIYYEIAQIFRGDVGIGQQHKSKTQELLNTLRFFPEDSPKPYEPNISYFNDKYNFSFKYPDSFDTTCCDLQGPAKSNNTESASNLEKFLVAAYLPTFKDTNNFDGFAVYVDTMASRSKLTFESYVQLQKQRLAEDYKVVTGNIPTVSDEPITLGNVPAHILRGYHWQGTNIIFVNVSGPRTPSYLAIVTKNMSGEDFQKILDTILGSFEYFPKLNK